MNHYLLLYIPLLPILYKWPLWISATKGCALEVVAESSRDRSLAFSIANYVGMEAAIHQHRGNAIIG